MPSFNIFTPLLLLCLLSLTTKISSQPLSSYCPNSATYTPNSTYHANLNLLLSNLSSNAITAENGFYNTTAGRSPNIAYGLFLCRGDVINDECQNCVTTASKEILEICPNRTVATVWYDKCLLRYSNRNIFSSMDVWIWIIMYNPQNVTEPERFRPLLASTMDELATRAASGGSGKKFATKEANFTVFQKLYGLVQCTPDLSKNDCNTCFRDAIARLPICCDIKLGARILSPSCNIRYEFYPFYTIAPPDSNGKGNGGISPAVILAIVVAVIVAVLLFSIVLWCNVTKARKKYIAYTAIKEDVGDDDITYDFETIAAATNNFSHDNKIGQGGFGAVYKASDPTKQIQLDWSRRYKIIGGIARGILYLHEDSQFRIIHRDLKASNILLDEDMSAKISDFGMAKIFGVDQTRGNTSRIVGTFGYMSPEYAIHGQFSVKTDVFSFGVLILEIITGKKNSDFYQSDGAGDLLTYAWKYWRDGTLMELMDPTLADSHSRIEVIRCIHIGLLCVQEDFDARPSMASVDLMLNSYSVTLQLPQHPPFFGHSRTESNATSKSIQ